MLIFRQYYKTLVPFVVRYGQKDSEAEDVVVETFHHIWQIQTELKSPEALHALLYTAVKNRALNVLRNVKNRQKIVERQFQEEEENKREFHDFLIEEEMSRLLDSAIADLPSQCRQVILSILAGKSLQEIAVEMQLSVNTVKTYKLRAIEVLNKDNNHIEDISVYDYDLFNRMVQTIVKMNSQDEVFNFNVTFPVQWKLSIFFDKSIEEGNRKWLNELLELKKKFNVLPNIWSAH